MKKAGLKYTSDARARLTGHLNLWNEGLRGFVVQNNKVAVRGLLKMRKVYGLSNARVIPSKAITMRTPGNDDELALTEVVLSRLAQVGDMIRLYFICDRNQGNVLELHNLMRIRLSNCDIKFLTLNGQIAERVDFYRNLLVIH